MNGNTCYKAVYHRGKTLSKIAEVFMSRSESLDQEFTDKVYKDTLALLPFLGWPSWPPREVPKIQKPAWWKQEKEVLPRKVHLPFTRLIEVSGLSQTGKSTLRQKLTQILMPELEEIGWDLRIWGEHFLTTR